MLYIEDANLAFVHIPKNAGQSIRRAMADSGTLSFSAMATDLHEEESRAAALMEAGLNIPGLGTVQPEHVPLTFLESHFPSTWATLAGARSFILARPPRDRFFSALLQRLREYHGFGAIRADHPSVIDEARRVCDWLAGRDGFCDMQFIHFSRQADYADLRGRRVVSAVFPIERTDLAARWVESETGLVLDVTHDHARREPKKWASSIQPAARFIGRRLLPMPVKRAIYPLWMNSAAFANASGRYRDIDLGVDVEGFIRSYYACDTALYAEAVRDAQGVSNAKVA
ncbi:MAG TPA: hypothetical protein VMQ93_15025 [Novosphingobium sp.]|nr:hypothetical protein [Novosphingobium sp.]